MDKVKNKYIFPNFLASIMSKIDMRTQYEASMMSMSLIIIGMGVSGFYLWLYVTLPLWYKIVVIVNVIAGFFFLSSMLVTTYQQYTTYMKAVEFQKQMKGGNDEDAKKNI